MAEVTTGNQLNAYEGNAALAGEGGSAVGYAKADLTPLENYAIRKYDTHLRDYQQQQYERAKLESEYMNPDIYVNLDKGLADQISPKLDRFKQLAKMQLEKNPNSNEYYEFKNLYADITKDNAKAKAVQTLKDGYKNKMGLSQDEHEKERMASYIGKLDNYKLGEDIPVYNKYFAFDSAHLPIGHEITGTVKRLNGDKIQTVKTTINNPMGLDEEAKRQRIANPKVATTGEDIGHSLAEHGGLEEVNKKAKEYADLGRKLNKSLLLEKYQPQFIEFKKTNPTGTAQEFILSLPGGAVELEKINKGHQYLEDGVQYITPPEGEGRLSNYTYLPDDRRLSVDNDTLRALFKATDQPVGKTEQILNEELSKTPAEIEKIKADIALRKAQVGTQKSIQAKNYAQAKKTTATTPSNLAISEVPLIGRQAKVTKITQKKGGGEEYQFIIDAQNVPEELRKKGGMAGFTGDFTKPVPTGDKIKDAEALSEYNNQVKKAGKGKFQMRFFGPDGTDQTNKFIKVVQAGKGTLEQALAEAPNQGFIIKLMDHKGNTVSTTETIDRKSQSESNKSTTKGEEGLGVDLPAEEVEFNNNEF